MLNTPKNWMAIATMAVLSFTVVPGQEETATGPKNTLSPVAVDFLLHHAIIPAENDMVCEVTLFSIVPSVKKMIVKATLRKAGGSQEKTLVLGLCDETFAKDKDGVTFLKFLDLKRGDPLVLVLGEDHVTVREIYRYDPLAETETTPPNSVAKPTAAPSLTPVGATASPQE